MKGLDASLVHYVSTLPLMPTGNNCNRLEDILYRNDTLNHLYVVFFFFFFFLLLLLLLLLFIYFHFLLNMILI